MNLVKGLTSPPNCYCFGMKNSQGKYWTAFYTKPRSEKKSAKRLSDKGFTVYCPTRTVLKQWSDRKRKIQEPLFTSYLFAKVNEDERLAILCDTGIVRSVTWLKEPVKIPESEIELIKKFLGEFPHASSSPYSDFACGDEVKVDHGLFKGSKGIIYKIKGNTVGLYLEALSQYIHAELSKDHLKTLS